MTYRYETFRSDKRIVVLQSLQVSHLSVIHKKFYELSKSRSPSQNKTVYEIPNLWNFKQRFQIPNCILNKVKYKILKYSKIYRVSFKPNKPFEELNSSRIINFKCVYCSSIATTDLKFKFVRARNSTQS